MQQRPPLEMRLLNEFQRDFPLVREPYAAVARTLGVEADWVLDVLRARHEDGTVSRVGAVFRPGTMGVSTLAAMAVPPDELARVAACVSARPEVNHNYEREHPFNLWFVATARDAGRLDAALCAIRGETGIAPVSLPLIEDYAIDLGFDFVNDAATARPAARAAAVRQRLCDADVRVLAALEPGLPLVPQPYAALARRADVSETYALSRLAQWLDVGVVKRLGVVVRHRALGYVANAMCVWDVPEEQARAIGGALARDAGVTLCYRRARARPDWPYNLFCMIHGRDRGRVLERLEHLCEAHGLGGYPSAVLFSRRAFKQRGARYAVLRESAALTA